MTVPARSPRLLLLSSVLLTVAGIALLNMPHGQELPTAGSASPALPSPPTAAVVPPAGQQNTRTASTTAPTAPSASVLQSALPPHGEGVAGDRAVQQNLQAAWPADLPPNDERELLTAGRALLRADATGIGRSRWPSVFPESGQAVTPAFGTARFRIQAVIARQDGSPDKAVVHLVWAGTDRGSTFTDLRIADWRFTRATEKGTPTWTPQRPT